MGSSESASDDRNYLRYNLSRNPFDNIPLEAITTDMELFVGREDILREVEIDLHNVSTGGACRSIITGAYGSGKTSMINRINWICKGTLGSHILFIKINAKVVRSFLQFLGQIMTELCEKLLSDQIDEKSRNIIQNIYDRLELTKQYTNSVIESDGFDITPPIFQKRKGVSYEKSITITPRVYDEFHAIRDFKVINRILFSHIKCVFIAIDESDYLTTSDSINILRKARDDIFQTPRYFFLFVGTPLFSKEISTRARPFREIIENETSLDVYRYPEDERIFKQIINSRLISVNIGKKLVNPFHEQAQQLIFQNSRGIVRRVIVFSHRSLKKAAIEEADRVTPSIVTRAIIEFGDIQYRNCSPSQKAIFIELNKRDQISFNNLIKLFETFYSDDDPYEELSRNEQDGFIYTITNSRGEINYKLTPEIGLVISFENQTLAPRHMIELSRQLLQKAERSNGGIKQHYIYLYKLHRLCGHLGYLTVVFDEISDTEKNELLNNCLTSYNDLSLNQLNHHVTTINKIKGQLGTKRGKKTKHKRKLSEFEEKIKKLIEKSIRQQEDGFSKDAYDKLSKSLIVGEITTNNPRSFYDEYLEDRW